MSPASKAAVIAQAKSAVSAQGVTRVMPEHGGEFKVPLPYITFEVLPGEAGLSYGAAVEMRDEGIRFHIYAETTASSTATIKADAIAAALEAGLHNFKSSAVKAVLLETPTFDGPSDSEDVAHRITDFKVLS